MSLSDAGFLLDVNVLVALTDDQHQHHHAVTEWFVKERHLGWGTCALTQAGFVRIKSNPKVGGQSIAETTEVLRLLTAHAQHRFWAITPEWKHLAAQFGRRIFGHQQVTDAYLLGMAVEHKGVFVTLDKGVHYLAGERFKDSVHVLG